MRALLSAASAVVVVVLIVAAWLLVDQVATWKIQSVVKQECLK